MGAGGGVVKTSEEWAVRTLTQPGHSLSLRQQKPRMVSAQSGAAEAVSELCLPEMDSMEESRYQSFGSEQKWYYLCNEASFNLLPGGLWAVSGGFSRG